MSLKATLSGYFAAIGARGGRNARGEKKRRTTEQCRKAAAARWAKYYDKKKSVDSANGLG